MIHQVGEVFGQSLAKTSAIICWNLPIIEKCDCLCTRTIKQSITAVVVLRGLPATRLLHHLKSTVQT